MKFNISIEKLKGIIQSVINNELQSIKDSASRGEYPDDLATETVDEIHIVNKIEIVNLEVKSFKLTNEKIYDCELFVEYDTAGAFYGQNSIIYDLQYRVRNILGIMVSLRVVDVTNKYLDYGQI